MLERLKHQNMTKICIMVWNVVRMMALKIIKGNRADVSVIQNLHPSTEIAIEQGKLHLSHSVFTRRNVSLRAVSGELHIGTCFFNQGCVLIAMKKISIGDDCLFGPNVIIVDHDHDYSYINNQRGNHYKMDDVIIGNNVWVGGNVTILRGTRIGDNCVIGAGCVVKGGVPANTIMISRMEQVNTTIVAHN